MTELGLEESGSKPWNAAVQKVDSSLPMAFMMDSTVELLCKAYSILSGFADPMFSL